MWLVTLTESVPATMQHPDPSKRSVDRIGAGRRIVVAMSGGVDSAATAALLVRAGHDVIGITLQLYNAGAVATRPGACCAGQDIYDARRVAEQLGIPHYVLDYEQRFKQAVLDPFAQSYLDGETPIPCVACNQRIKFHDLLNTANELGAGLLATGHYVERRDRPDGPSLYRAADTDRDQSYFLYGTTRSQLARLLFPLGDLLKSDVRRLAADLGLAVADKPDSQDLCFVGRGGYGQVIERLRPEAAEPGAIVHVDGRLLGRHDGIINFTVGQRRGIKVAAEHPLFVVRLEPATATVVVGPRTCLEIHELKLREVNWLGSDRLASAAAGDGLPLFVRIRSTQPPKSARLYWTPDSPHARVVLGAGETGVAPGQACVFYADGTARAQVLGGGTIAAAARAAATKPAAAYDDART